MKEPKLHYLVQFASRYASTRFKTLNASSALRRADALVHDAASLLELKNESQAKEIRFGSRHGTYEIVSYFAVGFVTCLEWHARSRLVDVMMFRPSSIQSTDVKNIATLALSQMVTEGATIPHLLGAATNVSHIQEYLLVFRRVFAGLEIDFDLEKGLRDRATDIYVSRLDGDASLYGVIGDLFEYRNRLVHEIDLSVLGHFSIRDMWELPHAHKYGEAVISCIKLIEQKITEHAPKSFPNRVDADGFEEDEFQKLSEEIASLEAEITPKIERWGAFDGSESTWVEALEASIASRNLDLDFLGRASFLRPVRYLDMRRAVQIEYLKNRLAFLYLLKSELDK
jgi:hypothetical protein